MDQELIILINYLRLLEIINLILTIRIRGCVLDVVIIIFTEKHPYIEAVKWCDFIASPNYYIDLAVKQQENICDYNICKEV